MNSSRANTVGYALAPVVSLLGGTVPTNSGLLRAVDIKTAEGTIVHPRFPAAVGWGPFHVGAEIVSAVAQALARIFPDKIAVLAPKFMMLLARWPRQGIALPLHTLMQGGAAGTCGVDGWGVPGPFSRATIPSIEMVESHAPIMLRRLELLPDSAGAGQWRGGFGTIAEFQFRETTFLDAIIEGQVHPSESIAGGHEGGPNSIEIGGVESVNGLAWDKEVSGKVVTVRMGGGAGWGDVAARDPMLIGEDVANELTSATSVPARPAPAPDLQTARQRRQQ
jgi:N-methylhydantoinase B